MIKNIYIYQNNADTLNFLLYLHSIDVLLYSYNKGTITEVKLIDESDELEGKFFYIISNKNSHVLSFKKELFEDNNVDMIEIYTPFKDKNNSLQNGRISLIKNSDDSYLLEIFKKIYNYIKENYIRSTNKHYYVAPCIYNDWLNYKTVFADLFKYNDIKKNSKNFNFENFVRYIKDSGYCIDENGKDIRNNEFNLLGDGYVIYLKDSMLKQYLCSRKIYYTTNSECIFLYVYHKNDKTVEYHFLLDERLQSNIYLACIFKTIEKF